jgi:hypothetical protein
MGGAVVVNPNLTCLKRHEKVLPDRGVVRHLVALSKVAHLGGEGGSTCAADFCGRQRNSDQGGKAEEAGRFGGAGGDGEADGW